MDIGYIRPVRKRLTNGNLLFNAFPKIQASDSQLFFNFLVLPTYDATYRLRFPE